MNRSYGVADLAGTSAPFANHSSSNQLFCPIAFYSKLSAETIDTNETPANIKRLGNALNRMHFSLCDSHHSFIVTHQSICSICHAFTEKYESLIFDDQLTDQMVRNQLMIGEPASKPDNELDDKAARSADQAVDNVDRAVDKVGDRAKDRAKDRGVNRGVDRVVENGTDCEAVDGGRAVPGGRPDVPNNGDKTRFCYYCNEIQLNRLPGAKKLSGEVTVQIDARAPNGIAKTSAAVVQTSRSTATTNHQRHHSDSFIRLKSRCDGQSESEQFV